MNVTLMKTSAQIWKRAGAIWVQLKVGLALIHTRLQPGAAGLETRISFNRFNGFPRRHCEPGRLIETRETVETVRRIPDASVSTRLKPAENESRPTFHPPPATSLAILVASIAAASLGFAGPAGSGDELREGFHQTYPL